MGYMTINNRRVAFTDEKNVLSVIRSRESIFLRSVIIQNCQPMGRAGCVWWKMNVERYLHPVQKYHGMVW